LKSKRPNRTHPGFATLCDGYHRLTFAQLKEGSKKKKTALLSFDEEMHWFGSLRQHIVAKKKGSRTSGGCNRSLETFYQ